MKRPGGSRWSTPATRPLYFQYALLAPAGLGTLGIGLFTAEAGGVLCDIFFNKSQYLDGMLLQHYVKPDKYIRDHKATIKSAAQRYNVPADLLAAVLLAELNDYSWTDLVGDHEMWLAPEKHSLGWIQMAVDDVWAFNLTIDDWGGKTGSNQTRWIQF